MPGSPRQRSVAVPLPDQSPADTDLSRRTWLPIAGPHPAPWWTLQEMVLCLPPLSETIRDSLHSPRVPPCRLAVPEVLVPGLRQSAVRLSSPAAKEADTPEKGHSSEGDFSPGTDTTPTKRQATAEMGGSQAEYQRWIKSATYTFGWPRRGCDSLACCSFFSDSGPSIFFRI